MCFRQETKRRQAGGKRKEGGWGPGKVGDVIQGFCSCLSPKKKKCRQLSREDTERVVWIFQQDSFLFCSKIYRVPAERDGDRRAECGDVLRFPERLRLSVPGDPVVVPAGARGPGARGRGGRCSGSRVAPPAALFPLAPLSSECPVRGPGTAWRSRRE